MQIFSTPSGYSRINFSIKEDTIMALRNGSDDWYKYKEKADKYVRKAANSRTSDERERWREKAQDLADGMRDKYGYSDENVEYIIATYHLENL